MTVGIIVTASRATRIAFVLLVTGCYAELRTRAELGSSAGTAVGGAMLAGSIGIGIDLPLDKAEHYRAYGGLSGERGLLANHTIDVRHANGMGVDLGFRVPWDANRIDLGFGVTGYSPAAGDVSELRASAGIMLGGKTVALVVGPTLGYWDAASRGTSLSFGGQAALRLWVDLRELWPN